MKKNDKASNPRTTSWKKKLTLIPGIILFLMALPVLINQGVPIDNISAYEVFSILVVLPVLLIDMIFQTESALDYRVCFFGSMAFHLIVLFLIGHLMDRKRSLKQR